MLLVRVIAGNVRAADPPSPDTPRASTPVGIETSPAKSTAIIQKFQSFSYIEVLVVYDHTVKSTDTRGDERGAYCS